MRTLIHHRYVVTAKDRVRDLATGAELPLASASARCSTDSPGLLGPLFDALDHGREAEPQWRRVTARDRAESRALVAAIAAGAQQRGYVPVAVRCYTHAQRRVLADELRDRAVVLIDADDASEEAQACLVAASATSSRPHVLVTVEQPGRRRDVLREARALFGDAAQRVPQAAHPEVPRLLEKASRAHDYILAGRHAAAERLLREVGAALERRRAHAAAANVGVRLARTLFERGRMGDVDTCAGDAARLAEQVHDSELACEAHLLQAWARLEQMRFAEAESIARAVLLCQSGAAMAVVAKATLARCLMAQGRMRELSAMDLVLGTSTLVEPRWLAIAHDVAVAALVATGQLFDAGRRIRAVLDGWQDHGDPLATAIVHTAHLRVVVSTGDLTLADDVLQRALAAADLGRAPLRALRARAVWCMGLARAGSTHLAGAEQARLLRFLRVAPPMLVREVTQAGCPSASTMPIAPRADTSMPATMIALAQDEEDVDAVNGVLVFALKQLDAARVDVVSGDGGPPSTLASAGSGPGAALGVRVLESGIAVCGETGGEAGVPMRLGARLVGALVARWPSGRVVPGDRRAVLECAAAVIAARVDGIQSRARETATASVEIPELIGIGPSTAELRKAVVRAARAPFSVLIEGESGVGKELVARAIHHLSARRERRFCDINCAALPDELFETELFGHAKGAFTGAVAERAGLFEEAHGGTLFLDEVADLSLRAQAKLLRAVQQQEIRRVGESFGRVVDVRFVAAANRQMSGEVDAGRFRTDLLYRLDVIHLRIAPLRERPEDIPVIAEHLWRLAAARVGSGAVLSPEAIAALVHYSWPGNVRELQNVLAALAVAAPPRGRVRAALLPPVISGAAGISAGRLAPARDQFERRFIELALARAAGNRSRTARALGLSRQGLLKSMARLGLAPAHDE